MKLSEQMKYSRLPLGVPPGLRGMIDTWADEVAQREDEIERLRKELAKRLPGKLMQHKILGGE